MKIVVNSRQVAHLWANQSQSHASNACRSFYFNGPTIYSYGSHFPIATFAENSKGEKAVLFTRRTYSVSTSGHCNDVRHALHGLPLPVHSVAEVPSGACSLAELKELAREGVRLFKQSIGPALLKASRARSEWGRDHGLAAAAERVNSLCAFAGVRLRVSPPTDEQAALLGYKKQTAKQAAQAKRRAEIQAKRDAEALRAAVEEWAHHAAEWRNGQRERLGYYPDTRASVVPTFLRLTPDGLTVQTSRGAEVSASEAKQLLPLILEVRKRGEPWQAAGLNGRAVDGFAVKSIGADGSLTVGCHVIPWAEVERFAVSVGWL